MQALKYSYNSYNYKTQTSKYLHPLNSSYNSYNEYRLSKILFEFLQL